MGSFQVKKVQRIHRCLHGADTVLAFGGDEQKLSAAAWVQPQAWHQGRRERAVIEDHELRDSNFNC